MKILTIDGNNLVHRVYWVANNIKNVSENYHVYMFLNSVKSYVEMYQPDKVLCVWDEKGVPCIAWNTKHPENIISEFIIPSFLSTSFQSIVSNKVATSEVYKDE